MTRRGVVTKQGLIIALAVLIVLAILFGGFGAPHAWGSWGYSPAGVLLLVLVVVLLVG